MKNAGNKGNEDHANKDNKNVILIENIYDQVPA